MLRINPRVIPRIIAWLLLVFIAGALLINILGGKEQVTEESQSNLDDQISSIAVAFTKQWMTLEEKETPDVFRKRIEPYVTPALLTNQAGRTNVTNVTSQRVIDAWMKSYTKLDATHFTADVVVYVSSNNIKAYKVVNVPLALNAETNQLVVNERPSFSPVIATSDVGSMDFGKQVNVANTDQLRVTLSNFFQKYLGSSDPAELSNFLMDSSKNTIMPKGGLVEFKNIVTMQTFLMGSATEESTVKMYLARVTVATQDVFSNSVVESDYSLMIQEQGDKYLIQKISP